MSKELEFDYLGYEIQYRQPAGVDEEGRMYGLVHVIGIDEKQKQPADWEADIHYVVDNFDVRFTEVTVKPTDGRDVTATIWKKVKLGDIRAYLRYMFSQHKELGSPWLILDAAGHEFTEEEQAIVDEQRRRAEAAAKVLRDTKPSRGAKKSARKQRRKLNAEHFCSITDTYNWAAGSGGSRGIYQRMADFLNEEEDMDYDADDMKRDVERARFYKFLPRPGHGKTGVGHGPAYIEYKEKQK